MNQLAKIQFIWLEIVQSVRRIAKGESELCRKLAETWCLSRGMFAETFVYLG